MRISAGEPIGRSIDGFTCTVLVMRSGPLPLSPSPSSADLAARRLAYTVFPVNPMLECNAGDLL